MFYLLLRCISNYNVTLFQNNTNVSQKKIKNEFYTSNFTEIKTQYYIVVKIPLIMQIPNPNESINVKTLSCILYIYLISFIPLCVS